MDVVEKSPYEPNQNAEKGVKLLSDMKRVLAENDSDDYRSVNPEATKIFGPTNAWCLVKANALIDKSGMVYSQEWCNGNIRGNQIGKIPKDLLLLCLVSKRFVKAGDLLLSGITRDLDVSFIVKESLKAWRLENKFKKIAETPKHFQFSTKKRDCYKCAIFVARAYSCYKAFGGGGGVEPKLFAKIKTCLDIIETHLADPNSAPKKRKKSFEGGTATIPNESPSGDVPDPPKRKRGRPRKHPLPEPVKPEVPVENALVQSEDEESVEPRGHALSMARTRPRRAASSAGTNNNGKKASLAKLVAQFEEQYNQMGDMYRQMGQTLGELKERMEESRSATEDEIRNELLAEVQQSIMKSFAKK